MVGKAKGRNAKLVKIHNRALVLRIIQQNELISRKEIAARTGLTQATITKITNHLLEEGLVLEIGKDEQSGTFGRKPIALSINKERYNILSLHLGRYSISGAVCNLAGEIVYREEIFENVLKKRDELLVEEVISLIHLLIRNCELWRNTILGIGISAPGTINAEKGILIGNYSGEREKESSEKPFDWSTLHLRKLLEEEFNMPVFADNCSNVSALAESWFGKGRGISNFVQYSIGAGIGSGVVIDGMLYRGEDDVVAEVGHITVDLHGEHCACGNIGCLELYAGFKNLIKAYRKKRRGSASAAEFNEGREFIQDLQDLFKMASEGDRTAEKLIREHGRLLGIGAVSLANIFNPEYIFVSSNDIAEIDLSLIVEEIGKEVEAKAFSIIAKKVKVEASSLGEDIHLLGGMALVLQDFFNNMDIVTESRSGHVKVPG